MDSSRRVPVLDPIVIALRSRRVIIAIVSIVVALLVAHAPQLAAVQDALIVLIGTLALALIGGLTWEDAARLSRSRAEQPAGTPDSALREVVLAILHETGILPNDAP